jgi:AraC family transcriptional regulator
MSTYTPHVGNFLSWDGGCLLIGRGGAVIPGHSHYALQIAVGATPGIRFRPSERDEWTTYSGAMIPSRVPHWMDATPVPNVAVVLLEPETRQGRAITERWLTGGIADIPAELVAEHGLPLFDAWMHERSEPAIIRAAQRLVGALAGGVEPTVVSDERVLRAVAYIRAHVAEPLTLEQVAEVACLSPSRFRHLFVEQTGMAFRPYVLWRRFVHVWEVLRGGASLSHAAHAAGFADAAHLSRTSKTMFGFAPSAMHVAVPLRPEGTRTTTR